MNFAEKLTPKIKLVYSTSNPPKGSNVCRIIQTSKFFPKHRSNLTTKLLFTFGLNELKSPAQQQLGMQLSITPVIPTGDASHLKLETKRQQDEILVGNCFHISRDIFVMTTSSCIVLHHMHQTNPGNHHVFMERVFWTVRTSADCKLNGFS